MILHLVKCEMCDNQFQFNHFDRPHERNAPESWFTLFQSKDIQAQEGWHFCSKACLRTWLTSQLTANDIILEPKADHEPYQYCCAEHWPMPERSSP